MFTLLQVFAVIFLLILLVTCWWYLSMPSNLPPGPIGLPIFGSMFDIWNPDNLLTKLCKWSKVYGPLYKLYVADQLVLVLADLHTIREALVKQGDAYAGRPRGFLLITENMQKKLGVKLTPVDQIWNEKRRFTLSTLRDIGVGRASSETRIKEEVEHVLDIIAQNQGRSFDPEELLHSGAVNVTCGLILGKRFNYDHQDFVDLLALIHSLQEGINLGDLSPFIICDRFRSLIANLPEIKKLENQLLKLLFFLQREITQIKSEFNFDHEPTNYVEAFLKVQRNGGPESIYNDGQLLDSAFGLVLGGDTIATKLRWAILYLCRNPQLQEEIYQEILTQTGSSAVPSNADRVNLPLTEAAITEVLRAATQHAGVLRRTLSPSKLLGYDIPQDTIVVSLLAAVLQDPNVYPNPKQFDPTRFLCSENNKEEHQKRLAHFLPFQLGKRACPGELLARTEMFLFFTGLITRYQLSFSPDEPPVPIDNQLKRMGVAVNFKICAKARKE